MTWTKIDSAMPDDPRLLQLPRGIRWMHVEGMVWCNQHGTDGQVPRHALRRVTDEEDPLAAAAQLVATGLWQPTEAGWLIVTFLDDQPLAADELKTKTLGKARQRKHRQHLGGDHSLCDPKYCRQAGSRVTEPVTNGVTNEARTDPTRPAPKGRDGEGEGGDAEGSTDGLAALAHGSPPSSPWSAGHDSTGPPPGYVVKVNGVPITDRTAP